MCKCNKKTIESVLNCKASAELDCSVMNDMLKTDGNLKELLDDRSSEIDSSNGDRSSIELQSE